MSLDALLGAGLTNSAATAMAATSEDPPSTNNECDDYPGEAAVLEKQAALEMQVCQQFVFSTVKCLQTTKQRVRGRTGFCNHCRDFKHIGLLQCEVCNATTCLSPGDGSAVGCVVDVDTNASFTCPSCYMRQKMVPPVRIYFCSLHRLLALLFLINSK